MRNVWGKVRTLRIKLDRNVDRQVPQLLVSSNSSGTSSSSSTSSDGSDDGNQDATNVQQPNQVVLVSSMRIPRKLCNIYFKYMHVFHQNLLEAIEPMDVDQDSEEDSSESEEPSIPSLNPRNNESGLFHDDIITLEQIEEFHHVRRPVHAVNLTVDEIWACLVALKMHLGISDYGVYLIAEMFNMAAQGTGTGFLPKNKNEVKQRLESILPLETTYMAFCPTCEVITQHSVDIITEMTCPSCYVHFNIPLENGGLQFTAFHIRDQLNVYLKHASLGRLIRKY
jgi:hypothetical protein